MADRPVSDRRQRIQPHHDGTGPPLIHLRLARDEDYDFLFALHRASMREYVEPVWGWDDAFQEQYFRDHFDPASLRIVELDGRAVGVIGFEVEDTQLYISTFEIDPAVQGRGIGSATLSVVLRLGSTACLPTTLHVLKQNPRALRFYRRAGFEVVAETDTHLLMRHRGD